MLEKNFEDSNQEEKIIKNFFGGNQIIYGSTDFSLGIYNYRNNKITEEWSGIHKNEITCCCYGKKNGIIASGSRDCSICIYNENKKDQTDYTVLENSELTVNAIEIEDHSNLKLVTGSRDGYIKLYDVAKLKCISEEEIERNIVKAICWVDENCFLQSSEDLTIRLWDCRTKISKEKEIKNKMRYIPCTLDVSDTNIFTTGHKGFNGNGCYIRSWDLRNTKDSIKTYVDHSHSINKVRFLNRNIFISISNDRKINIWNLNKENPIFTVELDQEFIPYALTIPNDESRNHNFCVSGFGSFIHTYKVNFLNPYEIDSVEAVFKSE